MIERTFDEELIRNIVTHDSIWEWVSDDGAIKENYKVQLGDGLVWLAVIDDEEVIGAFFLHQINYITWQVHVCMLPKAYGRKALKAASLMLEWIFGNSMCMKVVAHIQVKNIKAISYAKRIGFIEEGVCKNSILKNGELVDQKMFGLTKEEFICKQ